MEARDLIRMARRRAGLSQRELGERLGRPQPTIARWESGAQQPTLAAVRDAVRACGLELTAGMATRDTSYAPLIAAQLHLAPAGRVRALTPPGTFDRVRVLAELAAAARVIVIGEVAGALHGWPLALGGDVLQLAPDPATVDRLPAALHAAGAEAPNAAMPGVWRLSDGGAVQLVARPPGTAGFRDLHRDAVATDLDDGAHVSVASLVDLLRIAEAGRAFGTGIFVPALWATLEARRRLDAAPAPARIDDPDTATELLDAWLTRQRP